MAYVPGFRYDVFVSYAVADNIRPAEDEPGWVDVFERQLRLELSIEVKRKREVLLWRDTKRLSCGDNFTDEIALAVSDSAVMVVLLSNQYLASDWCRQERETFLRALEAQANRAKRLFIVQLTDPRRFERLPDGWNEIHHCRLWREDGGIPKRLGHPVPDDKKPEHQGFFDRVHDVAFAIAERLDEFSSDETSQAAEPAGAAEAPAATGDEAADVYLAVAPRSSREEAFTGELKAALENAIQPVRVVQPLKLPAAGDDPQGLTASMQRARMYVQVVGYASPPRQGIQERIADDLRLPKLFWKVEDVDLNEVEDEHLKTLVQQASVGTVEDAKRAIADRLAELSRAADATEKPAPTGDTWFVNHLPEDRDLAQQVFQKLTERFECIKRPLSGASEAELRAYFEQKLLECQHMVMVYGRASRLSVNEQVRSCFKIVASKRAADSPLAEWFVLVGPPQPPDVDLELDVGFPGFHLHAVDCRSDWESALDRAFLARLPGGRP